MVDFMLPGNGVARVTSTYQHADGDTTTASEEIMTVTVKAMLEHPGLCVDGEHFDVEPGQLAPHARPEEIMVMAATPPNLHIHHRTHSGGVRTMQKYDIARRRHSPQVGGQAFCQCS